MNTTEHQKQELARTEAAIVDSVQHPCWKHEPTTSEQAKQILRELKKITLILLMIFIKLSLTYFLILVRK